MQLNNNSYKNIIRAFVDLMAYSSLDFEWKIVLFDDLFYSALPISVALSFKIFSNAALHV